MDQKFPPKDLAFFFVIFSYDFIDTSYGTFPAKRLFQIGGRPF